MSLTRGGIKLYDAAGNPITVQDGVAIPAATSGVLIVGKDGGGLAQAPRVDAGVQAMRISTPLQLAAGIYAQASPFGTLRTTQEPTTFFTEAFDAAFDTVNKWTTGGTVTPVQGSASATFPVGTTALATSWLTSLPMFSAPGLSALVFSAGIQLESPVQTHTHRFWGLGTQPGSPTAAAPLTNAVGFEVATDGLVYAVVWRAGARVFASDVSAYMVAGISNSVAFAYRGDLTVFFINSGEVPVAQATGAAGQTPATATLPLLFHALNDAVGPGSAPSLIVTGTSCGDSASPNVQVSDAAFPWRRASVDSTGSLDTAASLIPQTINLTGLFKGKTGYVFNILGRRAGFTSITVLNDIKEFDNAVAAIPALSNSTLDIISSSVNDTNAAGTGARKVKVVYVNSAGALVESAAINLNGTTLVTSVLTGVNGIWWMEVVDVGSGGVAAGNIRLRINGGTVECEQITAGGNKSLSARGLVPTGYTAYLVNWRGSSINNDQDLRLRAEVNTLDRSLSTVFHFLDVLYVPSNSVDHNDLNFLKVPAGAKIKASTISAATGGATRADVSFVCVLIAN